MVKVISTAFFRIAYSLKFFVRAKTIYRLHSPFLFGLVSHYKQTKPNQALSNLLNNLKQDKTPLIKAEFGTKKHKATKTNVNKLFKSSVSKKYGNFLNAIATYCHSKNLLELGTNIGISAIYFKLNNAALHLTSVDACKNSQDIAKQNIEKLGLKQVELVNHDFDNFFNQNNNKTYDLFFFDGNHSKTATLRYFYKSLEFAEENSVMIFDDINWSKGMYEAWLDIKNHKLCTLSLQTFRMGVVFFRKEQLQKAHYILCI